MTRFGTEEGEGGDQGKRLPLRLGSDVLTLGRATFLSLTGEIGGKEKAPARP